MKLALNDEDSAVRKAAVSALVDIHGHDFVPELKVVLDDADVWVRFHTINVISETGGDFSDMIKPYIDDQQDIIRIAAVKALSHLNCTEALPQLLKMRQDKNNDVVEAVEDAIEVLQGI